MSWDDPTKMPLYHVQLETKRRTVSYEIATTEFDAILLAKAHYKQRNDLFVEQIHIGGYSDIGYVDKKPFPVFYEAKVVSGLPFEESEEWRDPWWFKEPTSPPVQQIKLHGCELCGNLTCRGTCFK